MKRNDIATSISFMVYAASVVLTPLSLVQMSEELSFTLAGGGALEAGRAFLLLITLFISGKMGSILGKCRTIALGLIITALCLILAGFAQTYWTIMGLILVIGFGTGFAEALINPLIHDTHPENPGKYLNIINAFFSLGVVVAVLISGFLLTAGVSWRSLFIGLGILTFIPVAILLPQKKLPDESGQSTDMHNWIRCLKQKPFWFLAGAMFFGAACEGAFTFWSASYIQLNFSMQPSAAGIGTAIFSGAMFIGRILAGRMAGNHHANRRIMLIAAIVGFCISIAAYFANSVGVFYCTLFFSGLVTAPFWPTVQAISPRFIREGDPTLLFILLSCAGIPGFGTASWIMGIIGDAYSLHTSLLMIPIFFLFLVIMLFLLRLFGHNQITAD